MAPNVSNSNGGETPAIHFEDVLVHVLTAKDAPPLTDKQRRKFEKEFRNACKWHTKLAALLEKLSDLPSDDPEVKKLKARKLLAKDRKTRLARRLGLHTVH